MPLSKTVDFDAVQTAQRQLADQINAAQITWAQLDHAANDFISADHLAPLNTAIQQVQQQMQTLTQSVTSTTGRGQETLTGLCSHYRRLDEQINRGREALQHCCETLNNSCQNTTTQIDQFRDEVDGLFKTTHQHYEEIKNNINKLHQEDLKKASESLQNALNTFQEQAIEASRTALNKAADDAQNRLRDLGDQQIQNFAVTLQGRLENVRAYFTQTSQTLGEQAQNNVEGLFKEVGQFAQEQGQQQIKAEVERLLRGIVERLSEEIMASIAAIQAGASITGSLAVIMPQLIVLNKLTEAIKDVIEIFKKLDF